MGRGKSQVLQIADTSTAAQHSVFFEQHTLILLHSNRVIRQIVVFYWRSLPYYITSLRQQQ